MSKTLTDDEPFRVVALNEPTANPQVNLGSRINLDSTTNQAFSLLFSTSSGKKGFLLLFISTL